MEKKKPFAKKLIIGIIAIVVVVVALASITLAYYLNRSENLNTTYNPAESLNPSFSLTPSDKSMKDVKINVGETKYPVFVRVAVLINWENHETPATDEEGTVYYGIPVKDKDYTIEFDETNWTLITSASNSSDNMYGYFYYNKPVESGKLTEAIIKSCVLKDEAKAPKDGYVLNVKIFVQTIQAIG